MIRAARLLLLAFLIAAPLLFYGAALAVRSNSNKVEDWLPSSFDETSQLVWFRQHFVADQFVVVSWDGCRLGDDPSLPNAVGDDPRIEQLANVLVPADGQSGVGSAGRGEGYFESVTTARRVLNQLVAPPTRVPYAEAVQRLQGSLIGPDGRQACLVVMLSDRALGNLRHVIGRGTAAGFLRIGRPPGKLFEVLRQCGLIGGLGLAVFGLSTFTPTQRFGWLMLTILLTGVVAELVMLPAILAGPLGRVFRPRTPRTPRTPARTVRS